MLKAVELFPLTVDLSETQQPVITTSSKNSLSI
jgi:hypothetical protein